jgi:hypothetical protein
MKTLEQIKDDVAQRNGKKSWNEWWCEMDYKGGISESAYDQVIEEYAEHFEKLAAYWEKEYRELKAHLTY